MDAGALLDGFGYTSSPNFLPAARLAEPHEHAHTIKRSVLACRAHGGTFHGFYQLRENGDGTVSIPLVYAVEAPSCDAADQIHRKIWNQNVAPFILTLLPEGVRVYSGFRYVPHKLGDDSREAGILRALVTFDRALVELQEFRASAIDDGSFWRVRGDDVDPSTRVDWRLLNNLEHLGDQLRAEGLDARVAHALIGKFVYLRYLRDREILSDRRLAQFGIDPVEVFGRNASVEALSNLIKHVDGWLNGSVFPLAFPGPNAPSAAQVSRVANVFVGDNPETGQLHLDLRAYDFSYIPVETLSVIYEQFLAAEARTKQQGAYYTPLAVINFILAQLADIYPLTDDTRIFDPSCGSGAFLVQCYRRLIERFIHGSGRRPRPQELRSLLVGHIFGVERDPDACRVAELSLLLTMLDYIEPPDLLGSAHAFKLPHLRDNNILEADFFELPEEWARLRFDWIVGNPPWTKITESPEDEPVRKWIKDHERTRPIARDHVAEAFAWKVLDHATPNSALGLLLPAMTFVSEVPTFRKKFFEATRVFAIANFTNLREMLFAGRARDPAAAVFYHPRASAASQNEDVLVYSPLVANQEVTRPSSSGRRTDTWTITVNRSEIRTLSVIDAASRGARPWHLAMWGSARDKHLLSVIEKNFPSLDTVATQRGLCLSQGLELRTSGIDTDPLPEVIGKPELDVKRLRAAGRIHAFPSDAITEVEPERSFVRKGRGKKPLAVSRPPHVIISATRSWAVYTDEFLIIPPRQIGLAGAKGNEDLLRAFALYLNSDFVIYHQFFDATQSTVRNGLSTLASLKRLPTPLGKLDAYALKRWASLHLEIVAADEHGPQGSLFSSGAVRGRAPEVLERELNMLVAEALGLSDADQQLIHDLVHVKTELVDGRIGEGAVGTPAQEQLRTYASTLASELDAFLDPNLKLAHFVTVATTAIWGFVQIVLGPSGDGGVVILDRGEQLQQALGATLERVDKLHSQWMYFDRNLIVYSESFVLVLKPMQRIWWTSSQARLDADEIIADTLCAGGDS